MRIASGVLLSSSLVACGDTDDADPESKLEACVMDITPLCVVSEAETAEDIEEACLDLEVPPVPLLDGGQYGPEVVVAGPLGSKVDWNVGADSGFENPVNIAEPVCLPTGVQTFNEPDEVNAQILNTRGLDYSLYTIFRPACMRDGETYPVITWANGTCGLTHGYSGLLATVASHGYVVIASNSTWTNTSPTNGVQLTALDYAEALNADPESPLFERLDLDQVGAMGHSQGAGATANAASDPRIKSIILWNGGASSEKPFLNVSGERDIDKEITPESMAAETEAASQPGAWVYYRKVLETTGDSTGHLVLMMQPERVTELAVAWWDYMLKGDAEAEKMFVGDDCGFCDDDDEFAFGVNSEF